MSHPKGRWLIIGFLGVALLLAACIGSDPAPANPSGAIGTGLAVAPEFEAFYNQNGGAPVFGFPISDPFVDPESGRLTQFFQHLNLEIDQAAQVVTVSPIGNLFAPPVPQQNPAQISGNSPQRSFPETGHTIQDEFLTFYEAHGDLTVFGPPITPLLDEGGKLVQYFQNSQLVWNPNAPPEFRVEIASLGSAYFRQYGPIDGSFRPSSSAAVTEAEVSAAVKEPILYAGEEQLLYVSVINPDTLQRVEGASVSVTVSYAGLTTSLILPRTDEFGRSQAVLGLASVEPGQKVQVEVDAVNATGTFLDQTTLSFKTWW